LTDKKVCKSNFIDEFKDISDEDNSNLTYCQTYLGQEPRYTKLIVDPYKKRYYRVTKLRLEIGKQDIKSAKWTIIIMNETFDIKVEDIKTIANNSIKNFLWNCNDKLLNEVADALFVDEDLQIVNFLNS
jgi:hypothetical protein